MPEEVRVRTQRTRAESQSDTNSRGKRSYHIPVSRNKCPYRAICYVNIPISGHLFRPPLAQKYTRAQLQSAGPVSRGPDTTASPGRQMSNTDVTFSFLQCLHVHTPRPCVGVSGTSVCGSLLHVHTRPLNRPHASSHGHTHHHIDHIATGVRRGALAPPLSLRILLRHQDDAFCHLGGRRQARR